MNTTELISQPQASELPTFGDEVAEFLPYVAALFVLGPITLLSAMLWTPFLLVIVLIAAPVAVAGVLGLGAAIVATPYLLVRHRRRQAAKWRRSSGSPLSGLAQQPTVGGTR